MVILGARAPLPSPTPRLLRPAAAGPVAGAGPILLGAHGNGVAGPRRTLFCLLARLAGSSAAASARPAALTDAVHSSLSGTCFVGLGARSYLFVLC